MMRSKKSSRAWRSKCYGTMTFSQRFSFLSSPIMQKLYAAGGAPGGFPGGAPGGFPGAPGAGAPGGFPGAAGGEEGPSVEEVD